jgi:hypothetical protein
VKYRPNPSVRLEAYQWNGDLSVFPSSWRERDLLYVTDDGTLMVRTAHGPAECKLGDHVAEDEARWLYPISRLVFQQRWLSEDGAA